MFGTVGPNAAPGLAGELDPACTEVSEGWKTYKEITTAIRQNGERTTVRRSELAIVGVRIIASSLTKTLDNTDKDAPTAAQ